MKGVTTIAVMLGCIIAVGTAGWAMDVDLTGGGVSSFNLSATITNGSLHVDLWGYSTRSSPPGLEGSLGSHHIFEGVGSFVLSQLSSSVGTYGELTTTAKAHSSSSAELSLYGWQDFEVSGGNPGSRPYMGELVASAKGSERALLDVRMVGSMYIFKDNGPYTYINTPSPSWMLYGQGESYSVFLGAIVRDKNTGNVLANVSVELWQDGGSATDAGMFGFSNAWAFQTAPETAPGLAFYPSSGTMYVRASGAGNYWQYTFAQNGGIHNGAVFGGPGAFVTSGSFSNGFEFSPSASAR